VLAVKNPATFVREYLDQFDDENWDGNGIKSMTVVSAEWGRGVVSGQETDIVFAKIHYRDGELLALECWPDAPPRVGSGHIFRGKV
jgi:hypothetical protein